MPTLKKAAVISLLASVTTTSSVGGGKASIYANAVPLNRQVNLDTNEPADLALLLTEQKVATGQKEATALNQQTAAKWGFLKNIVNIDRFFASGPESTPPSDASLAQKRGKDKSIAPQSLTKKKAPAGKKMTKLSQLHSKQRSSLEADIAGGISDDTATAAAEQALMEAANAMTEEHQDEVPPTPQQDEDAYDGSDDAAAQTADEPTDAQVAEAAAALAAAQEAIARETKQAGAPLSPEMQAEIDNAQETLAAEAKKLFATRIPQAAAQETTPAPDAEDEEISDLPTKEAKEAHAASVREEGLNQIAQQQLLSKKINEQEIDLEIEAPGAANVVAEEGASVITSQEDFHADEEKLLAARKKTDNKIGKGGFQINFKNPSTFDDQMHVIVFNDATGALDESTIKEELFNTQDIEQAKTASMAMAMTLQTEAGATIVDDQPGKESIIQNLNSDQSKLLSQISSGYAIRKDYVQKMAPGDAQFHMVSWDDAKKANAMKTFQSRKEADEAYYALGTVPKILVSGETGDILLANGEQNMIDQAVGMFYTQRYQGKYYGMP